MDEYYKFLVEKTTEVMLVSDEKGTILFANPMALQMLDYSSDELLGLNIEDIFLDKGFGISEKLLSAKGEAFSGETSLYKKNKTCYQALVNIFYDEEKNTFCILATDRTELIQSQKEIGFVSERAKEAGKVRDEFVANVTHELRTPVNGIKGHVQYLNMTELNKDQKKELKIISDCCINMEKLINNILDFSKLESGKFSISNHEFDFRSFIRFVQETNGKLIEDKGLRFIMNVDPSIPDKLVGDDFRLTQILNNLLSNALKFTEKGYIAVEVSRSMQYERDVELFFMVMDTGIGIPPEKKDQLFESFTQVDASISRTYGGTGLGLAITKQLVELMNGTINLESEPGKGSSFTFTVRMQLPEDAEIDKESEIRSNADFKLGQTKRAQMMLEEADRINRYGSPENTEELDKNLEKLSLCLELDNFEKAEKFAESIKSLVLEGPANLKPLAFRVVMMIRKEDREETEKYYEQLVDAINETRK